MPPIFSQECDSGTWHDYCQRIAAEAASGHIKVGRLDLREWRALEALGVRTLDELADLTVDDAFLAHYLPVVSRHRRAARQHAPAA